MEPDDAGEYSCEMTEKEKNSNNREFVTVSVFDRESEEETLEFVDPGDVKIKYYTKQEPKKKRKLMPKIVMNSFYSSSGIVYVSKCILTLITCIHAMLCSNMIYRS